MINNFKNIKINRGLIELKNRIFMSLFFLLIFRIGSFIPIPGINVNIILKKLFKNKQGSVINMFNLFSGGSLRRASIFSLGIMPYMSSSIIMQLLCITCKYFIELKKNDETGKYKINKYTYLCTIFLSIIQSLIAIISLPKLFYIENFFAFNFNTKIMFLSILSLISGTTFLMWLSQQITVNGIGNGISMIIFSGILSELPENTINIINQIKNNNLNYISFILILIIIFIIINFIIFIESSQRKIIVNYSRKYSYGKGFSFSPSTHLPIKINISGVTPIIFAYSIILLPFTIISFIINYINYNWLTLLISNIGPGTLIYTIFYIYIIFIFSNIYTSIIFNPDETSDNLKKSGAYIPGIRPGNQTSIYIKDIINKLTFIGACYVSIIYLIPDIIKNIIRYSIKINGTSILIIIVVILDIITQIKAIIISTQYESILKKMNIKKIKI